MPAYSSDMQSEIDELRRIITEHRLDREKQMADIGARLMRLETHDAAAVSREDVYMLKAEMARFGEMVTKFSTLAESVATKQDVAWMKSMLMWGLGILGTLITASVIAIVTHLLSGN